MYETSIQVILAEFKEEGAARLALQELEAAHKRNDVTLQDAVILEKDPDGKLHIKETGDMGGGKGAGIGAVAGGVIGLVAGPAGVVAGAALGGLIGGLAAQLHDGGIEDKRLKELGQELTPGSSALLIVVEDTWYSKVKERMTGAGAKVTTNALTAEITRKLMHTDDKAKDEQRQGFTTTTEGVGAFVSTSKAEEVAQEDVREESEEEGQS